MRPEDLSICIITKNECEKLRHCLSCLSGHGFELVVVDTGSSDGTTEMAQEYTNSIYHFEWINDFAKAKNYAVSMAKNDIVMVVDSDEYLITEDISSFLIVCEQNTNNVGYITRVEHFKNESELSETGIVTTERVFDRRKYHFAGCIHEQLAEGGVFDSNRDDSRNALVPKQNKHSYNTSLTFDHDGYNGTDDDRNQLHLLYIVRVLLSPTSA